MPATQTPTFFPDVPCGTNENASFCRPMFRFGHYKNTCFVAVSADSVCPKNIHTSSDYKITKVDVSLLMKIKLSCLNCCMCTDVSWAVGILKRSTSQGVMWSVWFYTVFVLEYCYEIILWQWTYFLNRKCWKSQTKYLKAFQHPCRKIIVDLWKAHPFTAEWYNPPALYMGTNG